MPEKILNEIHSLWIGDQLGPLENLCIKTWHEHGHKSVLWHYRPLDDSVPAGVECRDANLILPESELVAHRRTGSWALCANFFRYRLLQKYPVTWCDTDVFLLKPIDLERAYYFGFERAGGINNAVLRSPGDSALLATLVDFYSQTAPIPQWEPALRRVYYKLRARLGVPKTREYFTWGTFGPKALTHFAREHGVYDQALAQDVLYPVPWEDAKALLEPVERTTSYFTEQTTAVHIWGSFVRPKITAGLVASDSWFAQQCARLSVPY